MKYVIELDQKAIKDLKKIPLIDRKKVINKIDRLAENLEGDIKKLTNHTFEYRLRAGNWRVLFEIEKEKIIVYRVLNRKEAYR